MTDTVPGMINVRAEVLEHRYDIPFMFPREEGKAWAQQAAKEGRSRGVALGCALGLHPVCDDRGGWCRCVCHGPDEEWE